MLLSFCIPTHHGRLKFLREAIDSIQCQVSPEWSEKIEVCVSDNASEDGTWRMLQGYRESKPAMFVIHRNDRNMGSDYNVLKAVSIANGDYCWFLSSDDQIAEQAILKVFNLLQEYSEVTGISVRRANYDKSMQTELASDPLDNLPQEPERMHIYSSAREILLNCGMSFTYGSSQIFKRDLWMKVAGTPDDRKRSYYRSFPHVYILGRMSQAQPNWMWYPEKLVKNRTSNESMVEEVGQEYYKYPLTTLADLSTVWSSLVGKKTSEYSILMNKTRGYWWSYRTLRYAKLKPTHTLSHDAAMLTGYIKLLYFTPKFWVQSFPILLMPHFLIKALNAVRIRLKRVVTPGVAKT